MHPTGDAAGDPEGESSGEPQYGTLGGSLPKNFLRGQIVGKGQLRERCQPERSEVLCRSCGVPAHLLSLTPHSGPMKAKMLMLANAVGLLLTLLCYVWAMQTALTIGNQVLDYLDAVMEIAQLS